MYLKKEHHLTCSKAKSLLISVVGRKRYVPTEDLDTIYSRVEEELIQEQEAIFNDILTQEKATMGCYDNSDDPEKEECSICCEELLDDKEVRWYYLGNINSLSKQDQT